MFPPIFNNAARKEVGVLKHNFCCNCTLFASIVATAQRDLAAARPRSLVGTLVISEIGFWLFWLRLPGPGHQPLDLIF